MTEEQKKKIFGVAQYPPSDLHDLTPGTPPDKDFSNAKPSSQVAAQTFLNFAEPYLRPLTQEDLSFLTERGDRINVFEVPKRGSRPYREIWAEEDGDFFLGDAGFNLPANEGRGSIEMMADDMLDSDFVSVGPAASRWLSLLKPVTRIAQDESPTMNGVIKDEMDIDGAETQQSSAPNGTNTKQQDIPTATAFPESTWKNVAHSLNPPDYPTLDSRLIEELKHVGFLPPSETPSYLDVQDDEVTARLRYLQRELRRVSLLNGARKARILEIAEERMAVQEWQGISDDLDNQLNAAYLKRTRNIGKGKKQVKPRPGLATSVTHGVGEPIRSLMERRHMWNELIGPVVDHGSVTIPKETVFDKTSMDRLVKVEQENWVDDADDV
jgi:transcriptional adapter 3